MKTISDDIGIILIDHGSKRPEANAMLDDVVASFRAATGARIVEPAHMELAEPTLEQAFRRCADQGANQIVIHPYFLSPGRHSTTDIPRLATEAARVVPGIPYRVTDPLGLDKRMNDVILRRIAEALAQ